MMGMLELKKRISVLISGSVIFLSLLFSVVWVGSIAVSELTSLESQIAGMVSGTSIYNYDLELEKIAFNRSLSKYSFRSAGSSGANASADWVIEQFNSFGLETHAEAFQFANWDVLSQPTLTIDDDGDPVTTNDQTAMKSFQCIHYSWSTPPGAVFADCVVLPLPLAANSDEIGMNSINQTEWSAVNTTGKVVLVGREVRWAYSWEATYMEKLAAQTPRAVVYTWWYEWMSFTPPLFESAGGRPGRTFGPYYWGLEIPVGFVDYEDGLWMRNREKSLDVSARVEIETIIGTGPHFNVVGKLTGSVYPDRSIIVCAHRDTVMCSGFCDNGAGTAGVLELARIFSEASRTGLLNPKYTVLFILFDSEEIGIVGSANYVRQHKSEIDNIVAVINLDSVGSDELYVSMTDSATEFDLDELVLKAAEDLGINASSTGGYGGSDDISFMDPAQVEMLYSFFWGLSAGIEDVNPVKSSISFLSSPTIYLEKWMTGTPGWIHTSYDNSTSTATLSWVEADDLEDHIRVAALSLMRIVQPNVGLRDLNDDGKVDIVDVTIVAKAFNSKPGDPNWNETADLDKNNIVNIIDISVVAKDYGKRV